MGLRGVWVVVVVVDGAAVRVVRRGAEAMLSGIVGLKVNELGFIGLWKRSIGKAVLV